jgi:hypothetical protein
LSVGGVFVGLVIVGVRVITLPPSSAQPFAIGVAGALGLSVAIVGAFALAIGGRMRAAKLAFPSAVLIPIVVGTDTAVATNWLATHLGDPLLRLKNSTYATIAIDASGVHLVRTAVGPYGHIAASSVSLGPLGRAVIGMRVLDSIVLSITVGEVTAPLALVPMRLRGNPMRKLTDLELLEIVGRIESALTGRPVPAGWPY